MGTINGLHPERLAHAKFAYTTGRVRREEATCLLNGDRVPGLGDVVLAKVEQIGQHKRVEGPDGRLSTIFPGDEIVVCYGHRYAPDQFEADLPEEMAACHLVAGGGVAAWVVSRHVSMAAPTTIEPIGILGRHDGTPINLADYALQPIAPPLSRPTTVAVVGTSMNSGKTTTAAHLIRGLVRAGCRVGAAKVTGTGSGKDLWLMRDAGADPVYDFTAAGVPSTYRAGQERIEGIMVRLTDHLAAVGVDAIVLEVADGLLQEETAALVESARFADRVDRLLFAAGEAMAAASGLEWLSDRGLRIHGISGVLAASPLAAREAALAANVPVFTLEDLGDAAVVDHLALRPVMA